MKEIPLTRGQLAFVDDADYERVAQYRWCASWRPTRNCFYVRRASDSHYLHRFILDAPTFLQVDHVDGNPLNNLRANLRLCTRAQNGRNGRKHHRGAPTSRFKGVWWDEHSGKWQSNICVAYKQLYIGRFPQEEDAARAYDRAARRYFGEFARVNFEETAG